MAESYSVTAVLSAVDKNFSSVFGSAQGAADSLAGKIKSGLGFGALMGIGMKAVNAVTSSLSGFTGELENTSAAWQTFEQNARMNGHLKEEIASTKKELQSFAQKTIYSASDMATTYAQLDAVGIKSADSLVKGFGGIAAAAENPTQAMKTLSQQGVQMAAKPKVAWQDFKLMLEQSPAGIAAVAKEMGMTTSEMVQAVQDGKIKTEDFFKAVEKVGTSKAFTKLATSYKTTGQAMDGLSETVTNTLMPTFELFQKRSIKAVESVIGKVESINGDKIAKTFKGIFKAYDTGGITGAIGKVSELLDKLPDGFKKAGAAAGALAAVSLANTVLDSQAWQMGVAGIHSFGDAAKALPGAVLKDLKQLGKGFADILPPGLTSKVGGAFSSISGKAVQTAGKVKSAAATMWNNFASDSLLGKIAGKVSSFAGSVTGTIGRLAGAILGVGGQLAGGLQTMMSVALQALMPAAMIGAALAGLGLLQEKYGEQINGILAMVQEKGPEIITSLANGISSRVPELIAQGATLVSNLLNTFAAVAPSAVSAGVQIITSLVSGVAQSAPQLITSAVTAVGSFASSVITAIPALITTGMQLLLSLAQGISANLPRMAQGAMQAVQGFAQGFVSNLPTILTTAGQIIVTLVQGITQALPSLITGAVGVIGTLASGFVQNLPMIIQTGVQVIVALASGLLSAVGMLISSIPTIFGQVKDAILNTDWLDVGSKVITAIGDGIMGGAAAVGNKVGDFFGGIGDWIKGGKKAGEQYAEGCATTIAEKEPEITAASSSTATQVGINLEDIFGTSGAQGGTGMVTGFTDMLSTMAPNAVSAADTMASDVANALASGDLESGGSDAGQQGAEGLASGIESGASAAESAADSAITNVISAFQSGASDMLSSGTDLGTSVVEGFSSGVEPLADAASQAVQNASSAMQSGLSAMQSAGQQAGARFAVGIRTGLTQAATAAKASIRIIQTALKSLVAPANTAGRTAGTRFATGIRTGMTQAASAARTGVSTIASVLRSVVSPAGAAGRSAGSQFAAGIRSGVGAAGSAARAAASAAVSGFESAKSGAHSAGTSAGSKFASGISSKSGSARSAGRSLASAAKSGMSGISTDSIGRHMGEGLVRGLNSKYSAVASAARRLARKAAEAMRAAAQVHSPSKVTTEIGEHIAAGLKLGIQKGTPGAANAAVKIVTSVTKAMKKTAKKAEEAGKKTAKNYANGAGKKGTAKDLKKSYEQMLAAKKKNETLYASAIKEQKRYNEAYKWNLAQSKKFEEQMGKATSAAWKKTLQDKAKKYADFAAGHLATANKYKEAAAKYKRAISDYAAKAKDLNDRINGVWKENDFLRQAYKKTREWGVSASEYLKKSLDRMKNAVNGGQFKTVAAKIASNFKKAMTAKSKTIGNTATSLIVEATNSMVNAANKSKSSEKKAYDTAIAQQKRYEKAASWNSKMSQKFAKDAKKATGTEKKTLEEKAKKYADYADQHAKTAKKFADSAKNHKASIDKFTALASSYFKAGNVIKTAFTNAFNDKVNAAISDTQNRIKALGETYQKEYDAIIKLRTTFRDKLRKISLGDRFEDENTGKTKTVLTDYNVMRRQVQQYSKNLEKLKKTMPKGILDEIIAMDTEDGLAYTQKLLSLSAKEQKAYAKSYNQFIKTTTSASNIYYQPQIDAIRKEYKAAVKAEFSSLRKDLMHIGREVMQGFADGMKSKKKTLDSTGKDLAKSLVDTLKKKLQIHSPSKVMAQLGSFTGQGYVNGIEDEVAAARAAMQKLVEVPQPQMAMAAGAERMSIDESYRYHSDRRYVIETPIMLDGREIARGTVEFTEEELNRRARNRDRLKGKRK